MNWLHDFGCTLFSIGVFELIMLAFNGQMTISGGIGLIIIGIIFHIFDFVFETPQEQQ